MDEDDVLKFGFDLLDPTKIVPEELVPITKLGKMTLNRNPVNYFAETEQVMVCPPCRTTRPFGNHATDGHTVSTSAYCSRRRLQ